VALANRRVPNEKGYGRFENGSTNGIAIVPIIGTRTVRTTYIIRLGATRNIGGTFTAASKARRINVTSEQRAPSYRINKNIIKYRAGTYIQMGADTPRLYTSKGDLDVSKHTGEIILWMAATPKKPASASQIFTVTASGAD
jgi:hypothetical protein